MPVYHHSTGKVKPTMKLNDGSSERIEQNEALRYNTGILNRGGIA